MSLSHEASSSLCNRSKHINFICTVLKWHAQSLKVYWQLNEFMSVVLHEFYNASLKIEFSWKMNSRKASLHLLNIQVFIRKYKPTVPSLSNTCSKNRVVRARLLIGKNLSGKHYSISVSILCFHQVLSYMNSIFKDVQRYELHIKICRSTQMCTLRHTILQLGTKITASTCDKHKWK